MVNFLIARLKEPSTFAGFAGIALSVGMSQPMYNAVTTFIASAAALVAVVLADKK